MTQTVAKSKLDKLSTVDLIEQYVLAISSHAGRHTNVGPRQSRINCIVDILSVRADKGDTQALAYFKP